MKGKLEMLSWKVAQGPGALGMDEGARLPLCELKGLYGGEPSLPKSPEGCKESSLHIRSVNPLGIARQNKRNCLNPTFFLGDYAPISSTEFGCILHLSLEVFRSPLQGIRQ